MPADYYAVPIRVTPARTLPSHYRAPTVQGSVEQKNCGACWAITVSGVLRDRLSIQFPNERVPELPWRVFNADKGVGCVSYGFNIGCTSGCDGGFVLAGLKRAATHGLLGSNARWYACDQIYSVSLSDTFNHIALGSNSSGLSSRGQLQRNMENIQREVLARGPVCTVLRAFSDLEGVGSKVYYVGHRQGKDLGLGKTRWTATSPGPGGVYFATAHAVAIVGWGEDASGRWWTVRNSWRGQPEFRIRRGTNAAGIESWVAAPWCSAQFRHLAQAAPYQPGLFQSPYPGGAEFRNRFNWRALCVTLLLVAALLPMLGTLLKKRLRTSVY